MPRQSFAIVFITTLTALAQTPQTKSPAKLTPAQALKIRNLSGLEFSPDGKRLAFMVREPAKGVTAATHIWVMDVPGGEPRQWTTSLKSERRPHWSPDSRTLAFISDRDERAQVWLMHVDGGEAAKLTDGKNAIDDFRWSPDGKQIALLAGEPKSEEEEKQEKDKQDARVIDRDEKRARVWVVDVVSPDGEARKPRQISHSPWRVQELCWTPQGTLLLKATDRPESDQWMDAIYSLDLADGKFSLIAKPGGPFGRLEASPDGAEFGYVASASGGPSEHDLFLRRIDGGEPRDLTGKRLDRPVRQYAFRPDGSLLVSIENGVQGELNAIHGSSAERMFADFPLQPTDFAVSRQGGIAMVAANSTTMPELWLSTGGREPKQVSHFNKSWREIPLRPVEVVRYQSFDGTPIEATLIRPEGSQKGTKLPLVVLVHGGPTGVWADHFNPWGQLLAARGYLVLCPNIRGSSGYGHKFIEMNRADWGGADFKDVMAGVDWLIRQGDADPDRLGIGGWSYGGYMAMWAITQTTRFQQAQAILQFLNSIEKDRGNSVQTRNARLAAIRSFFRLVALRDPARIDLAAQIQSIPVKRADRRLIGYLTRAEIEAILITPNTGTWGGRRDRALLLTLYNTGARISETLALRQDHVSFGTTSLVRFKGKGRKERSVPLWPNTARTLRSWIEKRGENAERLLFPNAAGECLSTDGATYILKQAVKRAIPACPSLKTKQVSPHVIRHSTAMHLLQSGVDMTVIALWLGHESLETTHGYVQADPQMK